MVFEIDFDQKINLLFNIYRRSMDSKWFDLFLDRVKFRISIPRCNQISEFSNFEFRYNRELKSNILYIQSF